MLVCNGLVVRETTQGENNKILSILTKEKGVITATVRGAKKINSKNGGGSQLFSYATFSIEESKGWKYIRGTEPITIFYNLRNDLKKLSLASYFMQMIYECIMENQDSKEILRLTLNTLHFLQDGSRSPELLKSIFEMRFLSEIGLMPDLVACQLCAEYMPEKPVFLLDKGMFFCDECLDKVTYDRSKAVKIPKVILHTLRYICLSDMDKIFSFKLSEKCEEILGKLSEDYMYERLQRNFSSLEFYKTINIKNIK